MSFRITRSQVKESRHPNGGRISWVGFPTFISQRQTPEKLPIATANSTPSADLITGKLGWSRWSLQESSAKPIGLPPSWLGKTFLNAPNHWPSGTTSWPFDKSLISSQLMPLGVTTNLKRCVVSPYTNLPKYCQVRGARPKRFTMPRKGWKLGPRPSIVNKNVSPGRGYSLMLSSSFP